ncbi:phosphatase domain-containing putative toxin [Neisseria sp. Ec49-e6-T10]|uniref:phosphatase domain-containing putative toxin n=1 Tax=Neisseria sp. Ec49-e6-T10 TaxID=3140744 RepID=UPI003EB93418
MEQDIYWLKVPSIQLAIMARPRSGEWLSDEISGWKQQGIKVVVSLLEASEIRELELKNEALYCQQSEIEFISYPIPDRDVPSSTRSACQLVHQLVKHLKKGDAVAIHCRMGIGRSGLIAASVLSVLGIKQEPFQLISQARGLPVPDTTLQKNWLNRFCNEYKDYYSNLNH